MFIIKARNVNEAYAKGLEYIQSVGVPEESRAGSVLVAPHPVTTVYEKPYERVLLNSERDANPFFHLFESLWILQGRRDAKWLDQYVSDFSSRFAEDDGLQHGAYGFRMRKHFDMVCGGEEPLDQLTHSIDMLRDNPNNRRVVIQLWDAMSDLDMVKRDLPCNTQILPRIREVKPVSGDGEAYSVLDITVCNRSNDIIWGAYGANAVHFSIIQEVMAELIGVGIGKYYQVSNNWHAYTDVLQKFPIPQSPCQYVERPNTMYTLPMVLRPESWFSDLDVFMDNVYDPPTMANKWFHGVAVPMAWAHRLHKEGAKRSAIMSAEEIKAPDWRYACLNWLRKRS